MYHVLFAGDRRSLAIGLPLAVLISRGFVLVCCSLLAVLYRRVHKLAGSCECELTA